NATLTRRGNRRSCFCLTGKKSSSTLNLLAGASLTTHLGYGRVQSFLALPLPFLVVAVVVVGRVVVGRVVVVTVGRVVVTDAVVVTTVVDTDGTGATTLLGGAVAIGVVEVA